MSSKKIYTAAVIGAGRIGASFDSPISKEVLTHAHAIRKNKRLKLVGFVDPHDASGKKEAKRWDTDYFSTLKALFKKYQPDLIVIASPDATHVPLLKQLKKYRPKLIICEKPVGKGAATLRNLPPVIINYSRRFDKTVSRIAAEIQKGKWGHLIAVRGIYTGSLLHNGSHLIDLVHALLGTVAKVELTQGDARFYSIFELDLIMSKGRLRFSAGGRDLTIERPQPDPIYAGFKTLGKAETTQTMIKDTLPNLYTHAIAVLDGATRPHPSLAEAIQIERPLL